MISLLKLARFQKIASLVVISKKRFQAQAAKVLSSEVLNNYLKISIY